MTAQILQITGNYPPVPCGIGDYTQRLAVECSHRGWDVAILTSAIEGMPTSEQREDNVRVFRSIRRWDAFSLRESLASIRNLGAALIHIQYQPNGFQGYPAITLLPRWLKRHTRHRARVVVTLHELAGPVKTVLPGSLKSLWLFPLALSSDAVIVTNERDFSFLRKIPWVGQRLRRIPLAPVITPKTHPEGSGNEVRRKLGISEEEVVLARFGFVHNLRISRIPDLLQATHQLLKQGHHVRLLLIGGADSGSQSELLGMAEHLGIRDKLLLTGFCPPTEVSRYLDSVDIAVQLYPDGVSEKRSSLQAVLAHGLPVISTKKGPVPSTFHPLENILLIPDGSSRKLAQAIARLISDTELRNRLRQNAREAVACFNWRTIGDALDHLYRSLEGKP